MVFFSPSPLPSLSLCYGCFCVCVFVFETGSSVAQVDLNLAPSQRMNGLTPPDPPASVSQLQRLEV